MGEWQPTVVAILGTIGAVVTAIAGWQRWAPRGWKRNMLRVNVGLRELLDVEEAKNRQLARELAEEQSTLAEVRRRLRDKTDDLDDCERQRDDAWSELRAQRRGGPVT